MAGSSLMALLLVATCVAAGKGKWHGGNHGMHHMGMSGDCNFMGSVSAEGRTAFREIMSGMMNETRAQLRQQLTQWAQQNGVQDLFTKCETEMMDHRHEYIANMTAAIEQLPNVFQTLVSIADNESLTAAEAKAQAMTAMESLDPLTRKLVIAAMPFQGLVDMGKKGHGMGMGGRMSGMSRSMMGHSGGSSQQA